MRFADLELFTFSELESYKFSQLELLYAIFDRTILDVQRVKDLRDKIISAGYENITESEKTEWLNGLKGSLNASDLNRIESNLQTISDKCGFGFTQKKDWLVGDFPTISDFQRIQTNTKTVKDSPFAWKTTSNAPSMPLNNYGKINDVEKILFDSYNFAVAQDTNIDYIDEIYDEQEKEYDEEYFADNEIICDDNFII